MNGPSRAALGALRESLARVPVAERRQLAGDLFAVRDLLAGSISLARTLTDPAADPGARTALLGRLLHAKVGGAALALGAEAVTARWSRTRDLADSLEQLGAEALMGVAEEENRLDALEDDLFRFGRILDASPELSLALSDPATPAASKVGLIDRLLDGKADADAVTLVERAVLAPGGQPLERALADLVELAAGRRLELVAYVVSARPLPAEQSERLGRALGDLYGKKIRIQADVDPALIGGLTVHVGDEVVDGSVLRRIAEARAALAT